MAEPVAPERKLSYDEFVAEEHLDRLQEMHLEGPADLVVEIVSPESRLRDRGEKFAEYELAGVSEYWLLDPELRRAVAPSDPGAGGGLSPKGCCRAWRSGWRGSGRSRSPRSRKSCANWG